MIPALTKLSLLTIAHHFLHKSSCLCYFTKSESKMMRQKWMKVIVMGQLKMEEKRTSYLQKVTAFDQFWTWVQ